MATKKKKKSATASTAKQINAVLKTIDLRSINLLESVARIDLKEGKLPDKVNWNAGAEVKLSPDRRTIAAHFNFTAIGFYGDNEPTTIQDLLNDTHPLLLMAKIQAIYQIHQDANMESVTNEILGQFVSSIGITHVWPYWRHFTASTTTQMGMPALVAPLLKNAAAVREQ